VQERDDALLQIQRQVEKHRDVASLEEQHAAVIASMRSELNATESAAKSEQQLREDLQQQLHLFQNLNTVQPSSDNVDSLRTYSEVQEEVLFLRSQLQTADDRLSELQLQLTRCLEHESALKLELEQVKREGYADNASKNTSDHASFVLQASYRHLIAAASSCEYFALQIGLSYDQSPQYVLRSPHPSPPPPLPPPPPV
jgi:predicted membrane-bound mannosyltransferase